MSCAGFASSVDIGHVWQQPSSPQLQSGPFFLPLIFADVKLSLRALPRSPASLYLMPPWLCGSRSNCIDFSWRSDLRDLITSLRCGCNRGSLAMLEDTHR